MKIKIPFLTRLLEIKEKQLILEEEKIRLLKHISTQLIFIKRSVLRKNDLF
jgi:hypothetical protein